MFVMTVKFNRKTAVFVVLMIACILIGIVLLAGAKSAANSATDGRNIVTVNDEKSRTAYLAQYGWEVESPAAAQEDVVIPRTFSEVFDRYNQLQLQQGFDLSQYCGLEVELYTYKVTNFEGEDNVVAQLYILNGSVIGADIHSTALDGFMQGIK